MVDAALPTSRPRAPLTSQDELREVWEEFRSGRSVPCPNDGGALALSVDGSGGLYRFVCTQCGTASVWFEAGPAGMTLRPGPSRTSPPEGPGG